MPKFLPILLLCFTACSQDRYSIVYGPAQLVIAGTAYSPGVSVTIEEEGVAWFGPSRPDGTHLGYLTDRELTIDDDTEHE